MIEIEPENMKIGELGTPLLNGKKVKKHFFEKAEKNRDVSEIKEIFKGDEKIYFCNFNEYVLYTSLFENKDIKSYKINNHKINVLNRKRGIYSITKVAKNGKNLDLNKLIEKLGERYKFKSNGDKILVYEK